MTAIWNRLQLLYAWLKKHWKVSSFGLAAFLIILSAIFRILTPPNTVPSDPAFIQSNFDGSQTDYNNVRYDGELFIPPSEMTIATITRRIDAKEFVVPKMVENFDLEANREETIWLGDTFSLSYDDALEYYTLAQTQPTLVEDAETVSLDQALFTTNEFVDSFFPQVAVTPLTSEAQYMSLDVHFEEADPTTAEIVAIPLTYQIDSYPVFFDKATNSPFTVWSSADGLQRVDFNNFFILFEPAQTLPTISVEQAVENINRDNQAAIITVSDNNPGKTRLDQIVGALLEDVSLEYRPNGANALIPFYKFTGRAENSQGSPLLIEITTPAVKIDAADN